LCHCARPLATAFGIYDRGFVRLRERNRRLAGTPRSRHWAWADLMRRAFEIDVLACPAAADACA
jgi:hypothetical protein